MKKLVFLTSLFAALIIGVLACSKEDSPTPAEGDPKITGFTPTSGPVGTEITINGENFGTTAAANTVKIGAATATIVGTPTAKQIKATVPQGAVTGAVSVTVGEKIATSDDFTVTTESTVVLNSSALTLYPFAHYAESLNVTSDIGTNTIAWTSSDTSVATVDQNGLVTPLAVGSTTITATVAGVSASAAVTVADGPVTSLVLDNDILELSVGGSEQLTIATLEADVEQTGDPVWSSDNEEVAAVDQDGNVTAVDTGTATITVTVDNASISAAVTVSPNVYVAGYSFINDLQVAALWANGEEILLPKQGNESSAYSVFVTDSGDEYIVGADGDSAVLWKNRVEEELSPNGIAYAVFVDGTDVYVAGMSTADSQLPVPVLWVNGIAQELEYPMNGFAIALDVLVDDNGDIHSTGVSNESPCIGLMKIPIRSFRMKLQTKLHSLYM